MQIENILLQMGARNIAKQYDDKMQIESIMFSLRRGESDVPFKLPARKEPIKKLFLKQYRRPTAVQDKNADEQAARTAWKNVKEWVELQAAMVQLEQVEVMEVFLPYVFIGDQNKTFYQVIKDQNFKQLASHGE